MKLESNTSLRIEKVGRKSKIQDVGFEMYGVKPESTA